MYIDTFFIFFLSGFSNYIRRNPDLSLNSLIIHVPPHDIASLSSVSKTDRKYESAREGKEV